MRLKAAVEFLSKKRGVEAGVGEFITKAVKKSAFIMERNIKDVSRSAFNWKTGNLGRSIRANTENMPFGKAEVQINPVREGADVNYGLYLEYGTKYITPRAFIRKGVGISKKQIQQAFGEEAKKIKIKRLGIEKK